MTPSASEPGTPKSALADQPLQRRGLFAAAAAVVVGVVAKFSEQPVQAASTSMLYATDAAGSPSNAAKSSIYMTEGSGFNTSPGNRTMTTQSVTHGIGGIHASTTDTYGVHAEVRDTDFTVITSPPNTSPNTRAVEGVNLSNGGGGIGVLGTIPTPSSAANAIGVYGQNLSSNAGAVAGTGGFGVLGISLKGHGVVGGTNVAGAGGVVGSSNGIPGGWAGIMFGPMIIQGDFIVNGAKSAAVPHPDGSHRRLYCVESPESWFEDFGKAQLECGQAEVTLDPDFAAVVTLDDYHVFLTGYGDYELTVSEQTASGFRVRAKDATSANRFSWRVVAKRKDIAAPRFDTVTMPAPPVFPDVTVATDAGRERPPSLRR